MSKKNKINDQVIASEKKQNKEGDDMDKIVEYKEGESIVDIQDESNKNKKCPTPEMGVNDVVYINRKQEDNDIVEFQKTGDLKLLEKIYKNRIPTLKTWAYQHYYPGLTISIEDLFEELTVVFIKAANRYDRKRGAFNTCLFTFLLNRIKNIKNSKYAKKRISEEYEGPLNAMVLSLDYAYKDGDGAEITLKDIIASKASTTEEIIHRGTHLEEAVGLLAKGNPLIKDFLVKLSEGNSIAALIKEYRIQSGSLKIKRNQVSRLNKRVCKNIVKKIIQTKMNIKNFTVLEYKVGGNNLDYKIELKKTKESDVILKSLRELKKNRDLYMQLIKGEKIEVI